MKVWYVYGKAYVDIDDAVDAVVGSVGDREMAVYKPTRDDWETMIHKEARATLKHMDEVDQHDFMGVLITSGNMPIEMEHIVQL
jgi:hypothetical protein